jgi:ELWxxDGT repeat protein
LVDAAESALWTSDGTAAGTYRVREFSRGPYPSDPGHLRAVGGRLFFRADDGVHGSELWRTTPVRSAFKNASRYCRALQAAGESPYRNHGQCVRANR